MGLTLSLQEVREYAEHAFSLGQRGQNHRVPIAHRALGIAAAGDDDPDWDESLRHMEESLRVARAQGERPFEAVTHLRYAELMHKKDEREAAFEQLAEAEKLFAGLDMSWWSEQAAGLRGRIERGEPFRWFAPYADSTPVAQQSPAGGLKL
jgi:hypothetical protein